MSEPDHTHHHAHDHTHLHGSDEPGSWRGHDQAHEHASAHVHDDAGGGEHPSYASRPHPEHVVLELGDELGALIIHTDPDLLGVEVEISPAADDASRTHKEVLERLSAAGSNYVLVFDGVVDGVYSLWIDGRARSRGVRVRGGEIAELDWRADALVIPGAAQLAAGA
jgi:hypothetical protein